MREDLTSNIVTFQVSDDQFSSIFGPIASNFGRASYVWACATLALLAAQYSWLLDLSLAKISSNTPTLRRISAVDCREAYLARQGSVRSLDHLGRSGWRTSRKNLSQPRIFTRTETHNNASRISQTSTTNLLSTIRTCWSIAIPSRFAKRETTAISFFEYYQDSRLNKALGAYRMARRPSLGSTQIETSSDFNVDQESIVPIVARAISDPSPVRDDTNDKFLPPPEEHLWSADVCPWTPRRHRHQHRWWYSPGTHRTVPLNPREFENIVLVPPAHQEPQNQVFFAVIGAIVIIVWGAVVSKNNNIVIIIFYLLYLFFSFLAVFTDSFSKNNLFSRNS